jgi:hypothetical protein
MYLLSYFYFSIFVNTAGLRIKTSTADYTDVADKEILLAGNLLLFCYPLKAGLNQHHQRNQRWKKRPSMNPKNQCIFIHVNLCVSVAFFKII